MIQIVAFDQRFDGLVHGILDYQVHEECHHVDEEDTARPRVENPENRYEVAVGH